MHRQEAQQLCQNKGGVEAAMSSGIAVGGDDLTSVEDNEHAKRPPLMAGAA